MKFRTKIWIINCIIISLASVFLCQVNDFSFEQIHNEDFSDFTVPTSASLECANSYFPTSDFECNVPRRANLTNSLRTNSRIQRQNTTKLLRIGFAMIKCDKSISEYLTLLFLKFRLNFLSGMYEKHRHLITLRKLII